MGQIGEGTIKVDKQFDLLAESKKVEESEDWASIKVYNKFEWDNLRL